MYTRYKKVTKQSAKPVFSLHQPAVRPHKKIKKLKIFFKTKPLDKLLSSLSLSKAFTKGTRIKRTNVVVKR